MKKIVYLAVLLSACAEQPLYQPVAVSMPVAVPCKAAAIKPPVWPVASLTATAPLFDKVKTVLAELELRRAYESELEAGLKACE